MKSVSVALAFAIVSTALPARAAEPRDSEQSYRELQSASGLDLSKEWASYERKRPSGSFAKYVETRYRLRRNLGRGLLVAGASLVFASAFVFFFAYTDEDGMGGVGYPLAGTAAGVGAAMMISGGVLLPVYAKRLERLESATDARDFGLTDVAYQPAGASRSGLGLRFAF